VLVIDRDPAEAPAVDQTSVAGREPAVAWGGDLDLVAALAASLGWAVGLVVGLDLVAVSAVSPDSAVALVVDQTSVAGREPSVAWGGDLDSVVASAVRLDWLAVLAVGPDLAAVLVVGLDLMVVLVVGPDSVAV
jgi:hypothetical protein